MAWPLVFLHLAAVAMVALAIALSADQPERFLNLPGALVVLGGTFAALLASYRAPELKQTWLQLRQAFTEAEDTEQPMIERFSRYTLLWSRHDIRRLEATLEQESDPLIRRGMQLLLARFSASDIQQVLQQCLQREHQEQLTGVRVMQSLATFAPAFGMLGTLIGLVNLLLGMQSQSGNELGFHWAVALVTTFYGILLANLVFRPLATKLERAAEARWQQRCLVIEGLRGVAEKRSPALLRETLSSVADPLRPLPASSVGTLEADSVSATVTALNRHLSTQTPTRRRA